VLAAPTLIPRASRPCGGSLPPRSRRSVHATQTAPIAQTLKPRYPTETSCSPWCPSPSASRRSPCRWRGAPPA